MSQAPGLSSGNAGIWLHVDRERIVTRADLENRHPLEIGCYHCLGGLHIWWYTLRFESWVSPLNSQGLSVLKFDRLWELTRLWSNLTILQYAQLDFGPDLQSRKLLEIRDSCINSLVLCLALKVSPELISVSIQSWHCPSDHATINVCIQLALNCLQWV